MRRLIQPFRGLRGKLTLSYMLTSVLAFVLVEVLVIGGIILFFVTHVQSILLNNLRAQASQVAPYLANAAHDPEPLATWLQIMVGNPGNQNSFQPKTIFLVVTDTRGVIVASAGSQPLAAHTPLAPFLSREHAAQLLAVLNNGKGTTSASGQEDNQTLVEIVPILGKNKHTQGALVMKIVQPDIQMIFSTFFTFVLFSAVAVTILTAIIGAIFGYLIARGLTRRFNRLSAAAERWSRGDFSTPARDTARDELGQMARQLNHMAEELQNLLQTRQQLATLEERNRLARDLHDSVKQQVFAISMQIGATRHLLRRDTDAAETRLHKAEKLVQQAQQELTSLIRELRPVALDGKGLVAALRELIPQWSQQTDIVANLRVEGAQALPLTVEEALFRVVQEALSNVARHSNATLVQITLTLTDEAVTLTIHDNGQGCDPAHLEHQGVGLLSMQERMHALGGDMRLESAPGNGTQVIASCTRLGTTNTETQMEKEPGALSNQKARLQK